VNLQWAVNRMLKAVDLRKECYDIYNEDAAMCKAISERGLTLIKDGDGILTYCNAGALATSKYGTGLGALILGGERGYNFNAFVCETRPLLQGARITAFELTNAGIGVTLICDNMASAVMRQGKIDAVFVGADRVAANGDTANKIGTSGLAVLAKHYGVPFYVFCPSSTIDTSCGSGADIIIEEREGSEISELYFKERTAPQGVKYYNPAFDVTDGGLITAIVTETAVRRPASFLCNGE
jgi:methylthioribose-1-phosphate isomerase